MQETIVSELNAALAAVRGGDLNTAGAIAQRLLQNYPGDAAVYQLLAEVALRQGEIAQAMRFATESLARRPDHVPALLLAGRAARAAKDLAGAVGFFRRAIALAPERADAAFLTCATFLELGDPDAGALLTRLLESFPDDSAGWSLLGDSLHTPERWKPLSRRSPAPPVPIHRSRLRYAAARFWSHLVGLTMR